MLDRERVFAKLDELEGYLRELQDTVPTSLEEYLHKAEKGRACERLWQIAIESATDICGLLATGLRLGLPAEEDDPFEKPDRAGIPSASLKSQLRQMRCFRNLLVHQYGRVDDRIVHDASRARLPDSEEFRQAILKALQRESR